MTWTETQIREHNRRIAAAEAAARGALRSAKPQLEDASALERPVPRKVSSLGKVTVRFTGRRVRLLDPDNFSASCKDLLDGCVKAELVPNDSPDQIVLVCEQEKVAHRQEEMTIIEIEYPK